MKIVIAENNSLIFHKNLPNAQAGVALLQVLLLSTLISLLCIRFTQTARDQLLMAHGFDDRVKAELVAHSVVSEILFFHLSDKVKATIGEDSKLGSGLIANTEFNHYGDQIEWREGVRVKLQDLNGLLPLMFPDHILWKELLSRMGFEDAEASHYLGVLTDVQDADSLSFSGGEEPEFFPNGSRYLNGYAQNSKALEWVFADRQEALLKLQKFSDAHAPSDLNVLNIPTDLLAILFDEQNVNEINALRQGERTYDVALRDMLPSVYTAPNIYIHDSNRLAIDIEVDYGLASWREKQIIYFTVGANQPFKTILRN